MTRALSYTEASIARIIKGVMKAGLHVVGVKPDGTLITADKPLDPTSLALENEQKSSAAETRRMTDYFHGGSSEAQGA